MGLNVRILLMFKTLPKGTGTKVEKEEDKTYIFMDKSQVPKEFFKQRLLEELNRLAQEKEKSQ
jgi:hypothetical protein